MTRTRYLFTGGVWHRANRTHFLWLEVDCGAPNGAGLYVVLSDCYPKETLPNALVATAQLIGYDQAADATKLCPECFK